VPLARAAVRRRPAKPDLVERSVTSISPATVHPGDAFTVRMAIRNAGRGSAPRSVATFSLSGRSIRSVGAWDAGSRAVPALRPGRSYTAVAHLRVPRDDSIDGRYFVIACADGRAKLRESNERNNCRPTVGAITVAAVPQPAFPLSQSYPGLTGSGTFSFTSDPSRLGFQLSLSGPVSWIDIWVPGGGNAAFTSPFMTGCASQLEQKQFNGRTYTLVYCDLYPHSLPANTTASGYINMESPASAGMGGYFYGSNNNRDQEGGPFTFTGP
jgi:hypothetical protein